MTSVLYCIADQHQRWLVALAVAVCLATAISAVLMLRLSFERCSRPWALGAGVVMGFGVWSTHFIAMLGYLPGVAVSYRPVPTVQSLILAMTLAMAGTLVTWLRPTRTLAWWNTSIAALLMGGGFSAMHYLGMSAVELPMQVRWNPTFVGVSVVLAVLPLLPALALVRMGRFVWLAPVAICLAVASLHFTGMAAIHLVPSVLAHRDGVRLSPAVMSALVGAAALGVVAGGWAAMTVSRRVRAVIEASERDLSILVRGISDCALYMLTPDGRVANWNAGAQRLKGYSREEAIGLPLTRFYVEEDRRTGLPQRALDIARTTGKFSGEGFRLRKDGTVFWAHITIERIADAEGRFVGFAKIIRDMTRFKEDQDRICAVKAQLDTALDNMHHGLALFDMQGQLVLCNRRLAELWAIAPETLVPGMSVADLAASLVAGRPATLAGGLHLLEAMSARGREPCVLEWNADFVLSVVVRVLDDGGWVTTFEDITERHRAEARLAHMAHHDLLTGLPNRPYFIERCSAQLVEAAQVGQRLAIVRIDLARFHQVKDGQGLGAGDALLVAAARRLEDACGEGEWVARLDGDQFAVASLMTLDQTPTDLIERLQACFTMPFAVLGQPFSQQARLGVTVFPDDGRDCDTLLSNTELALMRAKKHFGDPISYYCSDTDDTARRRRQIAADLRHAVERGELHLLFQPQHAVEGGGLVGYEALLRWRHPEHGLIGPADFIPMAEQSGEIFAIGEWVLRAATQAAAHWEGNLKVAVNLSPVQLQQDGLVPMIHQILLDSGLPARRLELEITESAIIADKVHALHRMRQIKALGISIALDDFGTGYSSLDTLGAFPFDKIKVDKSFLDQSAHSAQAIAILRAVLALGRSLGIPVLAEGVETRAQLDLLVREGCAEGQGYFFGRPQPLDGIGRKVVNG